MRKANVTYKDSGETIFPPYAIQHFNLDFHDEADSVNALGAAPQAEGDRDDHRPVARGQFGRSSADETTINSCGNPSGPIVDVVQRFDREIDLVVTGHTNWALVPSRPPARSNPFASRRSERSSVWAALRCSLSRAPWRAHLNPAQVALFRHPTLDGLPPIRRATRCRS